MKICLGLGRFTNQDWRGRSVVSFFACSGPEEFPKPVLHQDPSKKRDAYKRIDLEKSQIDVFWNERPGKLVFPKKGAEGDNPGGVVSPSETGGSAETPEQQHGCDVEHSGKEQRSGDPIFGGKTVEPLPAVKICVERAVNEVESERPAEDGRAQEHGRKLKKNAANCHPCPYGSDSQSESQKQVRKGGETLGETVETQDRQHQGALSETERVEFCRGDNRQKAADLQQAPSMGLGHQCVALLGPGIEFVKIPVHESVEAHGKRPGGDRAN